ncbi:hypothetical protein JCM8097_000897 [Rhodosporidiobolus ruineniae]
MTTLDPSHLPGLNYTHDRTTGQAVQTSVPASSSSSSEPSALRTLSERLAEADRKRRARSGRGKAPRHAEDDSSDEDDEARADERVPVPPIPDLRFEQGVLASLRPFIHRVPRPSSSSSSSSSSPSSASLPPPAEKTTASAEKQALVSTSLTAESSGQAGATAGELDVFDLSEGVRVEWGRVGYVLLRDQVVFPLLHGILWALGGYYLSAFWSWNRARLDASARGLPRPSLLRSLGVRAGY